MATKKSTTAQAKPKSTFVGKYVSELELVLIASAVSGKHSLLIGAPGWGKTAIARELARMIANDGEWTFTRFATSTPPEAVTGPIDPAAALDSPPRIVYNKEGTPYDPGARLSIFDEMFRPSDVIFDILLDLLDRQDVGIDLAPTIWGTSNFIVKSERTEALRDRISLWIWVTPDELDVRSVIDVHMHRDYNTQLSLTNGRPIPTMEQIDDIRKSTPTQTAIDAVGNYLDILAHESTKAGFSINPRRLEQWSSIVYRTSVYLLDGDNDFSAVPSEISTVMKFAYPCFDRESDKGWNKWQEIASSVTDPIGSAIETVTQDAYAKFRQMSKQGGGQFEVATELGKVLANAERNLHKIAGEDDERVKESMEGLQDCFAAICRGENPF